MKNQASPFRWLRTAILIAGCLTVADAAYCFPPSQEFYQLKIYHLKDQDQEGRVDKYLKDAFLPAVHRFGIKKLGVFKPVGNDTSSDRRIIVLIPFNSLEHLDRINSALTRDRDYQTAGQDYLDALHSNPAFQRIETILLKAFPDAPRMLEPGLTGPRAERIYELRSYESATEKQHINKVQMFNKGGEVKLFKRLGFNAVFYASVIAGCTMPNLMYMTTFENQASRDEHWKTFSSDPEWKTVSALPEYQNNVSKNVMLFLRPTEYSDI